MNNSTTTTPRDEDDFIMTAYGEIRVKNVQPERFNTTAWLAARQAWGGGRGLRAHSGAGRRCRVPLEAMASTIAW